MHPRNKYLTLGLILTTFFSTLWFVNISLADDNESAYYKIDKGLFYLKEVFETVSRNYVEDLDPESLSKSAINGMLKDFDPYTVFFEDPGSHQMRMITRGRYGGVGMEIGIHEKKITVIAPMDDTPADRAGVRAGDVIVKIDGLEVGTESLEETSRKLRGKIGTSVKLEFKRPGTSKPVKMELVREEILIEDVSYADFLEPGTAYIRLAAFSDKASQEVKDAIRSLQSRQKIERVVLDLRGNPGGLLTSAVEIANIFLAPGQLVVSTRGSNESENKFYTKEHPILPNEPLVVLVDGASASASEIVAGAIQDLDRGVLVGEATFGKGLVQKVYPIDRVSQAYLKITTAKYYVPSGRSIQKEAYKKNNRVFTNRADSVEYNKSIDFFTQNGRVVHGGGGIKPDVERLTAGTGDPFMEELVNKGYLFQFAVEHLASRPALKSMNDILIDATMLAALQQYLADQKFSFEIAGEKELKAFLDIAVDKKYSADIRDLVGVAKQKLNLEKEKKFRLYRDHIVYLLKAEFTEKLAGSQARLEALLDGDQQLNAGLKVLQNVRQYAHILAVHK